MAWRRMVAAALTAAGLAAMGATTAVAADAETVALQAAAARAPDLTFPAEASAPFDVSSVRMAVLKPEGDGPFPALVLFHQCGGISGRIANTSMLDWAKRAVAHGYVALLIDAFGQRGVDSVCHGPKNNVTFARGVRDAFQAAAHLRRFPFVDPDRVGLAGYSWGAMVGLLASSRGWGEGLGEGQRFGAVVSMYPGCFTIRPPTAPAFEIARPDIDRPVLVLMGADDTETPPGDCLARLEPVKAGGAPVEMHVYPGTTHCWDCRQLNGFRKTDSRGNAVEYRFADAVAADSEARMFDFLARVLGPGRR